MVADEDDQRVVGVSVALQGFEQEADADVESLDGVVIAGDTFALFGRVDPLKRQDGLFARFDERLGDAVYAIAKRPVAALFRLRVQRAISVRVGVVDHEEEGLVSGLGEELGGMFGDTLHIPGIHVALFVVIELERIHRGDMKLADDPGSVASALKNVGKGGIP